MLRSASWRTPGEGIIIMIMKLNMRKLLIDPRIRIFSLLCLTWLVGIWQQQNWQAVYFPLFAITVFAGLDLAFTFLATRKLYFPASSLVSGLLIGLLIHPSAGIFAYLLAVFWGFASKHFLKLQGRHIFNPAALGVVTAPLMLNFPISWWAASGNLLATILPLLSIYTLYKLHRLQLPLTFLAGYFLFLYLVSGLKEAITLTFDGTVLFFSFIMLPEPMTSNTSGRWHYGFSFIVLGVLIATSLMEFTFADLLLFALLMANLSEKLISYLSKVKKI